jgi:proline iminopeptidase
VAGQPSPWVINNPTLIIAGRDDFICGPSWAQPLHRQIPGSELRVLDGCGHLGHLEQPDLFESVVAPILTG